MAHSPIVQTCVAALRFLARTGSKYLLCILLHENNTINLYLGVNQQGTVIQSDYSGPISLVSLMGGESYDLHREENVITLIKHCGSALKNIVEQNELDSSQTSQTRLHSPSDHEDEAPSKKIRNEVSTLIKTSMFCWHYNIPK